MEDEPVFINQDDLHLSLADDQSQKVSRHEFYFYPDNEDVTEGWRSYKVEDENPFGSVPNNEEARNFLPLERNLLAADLNPAPITHKVH